MLQRLPGRFETRINNNLQLCYQCTKKTPTENVAEGVDETPFTPKYPEMKVIDSYNLDLLQARYPQASYPVCELYRKGTCPHGQKGLDEVDEEQCKKLHPKVFTPYKQDSEYDEYDYEEERTEADGDKDQRPMCKFFLRSRCKHGIYGKDCKYQHKKVCRKFLSHGRHSKYGCNKGQYCDYFHVKMCFNSLNQRVCTKQECRFSHIKGTKRSEENLSTYEQQVPNHPGNVGNVSSSEAPTSERSSNPNAWNPPSEHPFLLITKQLSAQIATMQQQQNFILNKIQLSHPQHPHQPQQQVSNPHQPQPPQQVPPNLLPSHVHRAEQSQVHRAEPTDAQTSHNQMLQISSLNQITPHQPLHPQNVQQMYYYPAV